MMIRWRSYALILIAAVAACKRDEPPPGPAAVQHVAQPNSTAVVLPTRKGNLQLLTSTTVPRFLTYYPVNMVHEERKTTDCDGHYFFAKKAGARDENAYLLMCIMENGLTQEQAIAVAKKLKADIDQPGMLVDVELKLHDQRYYMIVKNWPNEDDATMTPSSRAVLDQWQWLDAS